MEGDAAFSAFKQAQGQPGDIRDRFKLHDPELVNAYASMAYAPLNLALRGRMDDARMEDSTWDDEETKRYTEVLDRLIAGTKPLEQPATVWRGASGRLASLKPGDTFTDNGYVSTSTDKATAATGPFLAGRESGKGILTKIHIPAGTKALVPEMYDGRIAGLGEREVVLPRGGKFRVISNEGGVMEMEWVSG